MSREADKTRQAILDAAWAMLENQPPQTVRMSDIAKAAGVSRQAVYLHFGSRSDLIRATRDHIDQQHGFDTKLAEVFAADGAVARLSAYVALWAGYLPRIRGVAGALLAARAVDEAADAAWGDCMTAHRQACQAIIEALYAEKRLAPAWDIDTARDLLWSTLSYEDWQLLTGDCGWSAEAYGQHMEKALKRLLVGRRD